MKFPLTIMGVPPIDENKKKKKERKKERKKE